MHPHTASTRDDMVHTITYWPIDIPMTDPFVVATGARETAENVFIRITLRNGMCGYGEAAPFPEVGAEDHPSSLDAIGQLARPLIGRSIKDYRQIAAGMVETAPLLLSRDPVQGGYRYDGPILRPWTEPGLGISVSVPEDGSATHIKG